MALAGYQEVASVQFITGYKTNKVYQFALYNHAVREGDHALVKSNIGMGGFGIVKVVKVTPIREYSGALPTAEVVCKVDLSAFEDRCKRRKDKEAIKKELDKYIDESHEIMAYQIAAAANPEMVPLLIAYLDTLGV